MENSDNIMESEGSMRRRKQNVRVDATESSLFRSAFAGNATTFVHHYGDRGRVHHDQLQDIDRSVPIPTLLNHNKEMKTSSAFREKKGRKEGKEIHLARATRQ